jgi:hypothetical protein
MNTAGQKDPLPCTTPIETTVLADYWINELTASEIEVVEEHLFRCDACGERLRELVTMMEGICELVRQGNLSMVLSEGIVQRASNEGLRIRSYSLPAGGSVDCSVDAEDQILISHLAADLTGTARVDLVWLDDQGTEHFRLPDIPFKPESTQVIYQECIDRAKAMPSATLVARLVAVEQSGLERVVGEYRFQHSGSTG